MYAPKLRFMTDDERWAEGFAHRIDTKAAEIQKEITELFTKAKAEFAPPMTSAQYDTTFDDLLATIAKNDYWAKGQLEWQREMARGMQNIYPQGAYNSGAGLLGNLGMAGGNPLSAYRAPWL